jgi:O-antigen/teichoic acid export membrane protein
MWYFYSQADIFIVGKMLGRIPLGYYSVAMHIASLPLQKVGSIIGQVGLPAYSRVQENREVFINYVLKVTRAIGVVSIPVFFGISSIAAVLVPSVLGGKWIPAIVPLQLLSLVVPLRILSTTLHPAVVALGRPDINLKYSIFACIVMPVSFLIGTGWGILGVSIAWILSYPAVFLYILVNILPLIGLSARRFFSVLISPFIFGCIMYGTVYLLRLYLVSVSASPALIISVMTLAGGIVYGGGMFVFQRNQVFEVINMLRRSPEDSPI